MTDLVFTVDGISFHGRPDAAREPELRHSAPSALVAFGDSFTYGEELDSHELRRTDDAYRLSRVYPTLLARELGISEVINRGEVGASNAKILRNLCDFVTDHRHDATRYFYVVSFTHPSRKAFVMKDGGDGRFISWAGGMGPKVLRSLCMREFFALEDDALANDSINQELSHKLSMVSAFLRRMGCRFVAFPAWNFAASDRYFQKLSVAREAALFLGERQTFGMKDLVSHLPMGPRQHPLSEGHALFARELAAFVRERDLL